ncbi:hypothetical protein C0989_008543 [Termitomyces sp. Mn162]|nr:hypothetical protein C0989_008543 [Termitomyces sp. Mn162]
MPPPKLLTRAQQPATLGLGRHFTSPIKRSNKAKTMTLVQPLGRREQIQRLQEKLDTLRKGRVQPCPTVSLESATSLTTEIDPTSANEPCLPFEEALDTNFDVPQETPRPRRIVPDQSAKNLYSAWSDALTRLVAPYLDYITSSTGNVPA